MILVIIKIICLLLAVTYGYGNTIKAFRGQAISGFQTLAMAIGIVGFVVVQFKLYL